MSSDLEARVQALEDRAAIADVIVRFAWGLDMADWDLYGSTLADELVVDFHESTGMDVRTWTRQEWCDYAALKINGFKARQHIASNPRIDLDGDRARCRSYMYAQHYLPDAPGGDTLLMRGWYDLALERRPAGWQITSLTQHYTWGTGNDAIFETAQARAQALAGSS